MARYTYHGTTMHIHTCHQPGSSMEAHMYNAQQLGMRYIRFTDHDTRVGAMANRIHHYDFDNPDLKKAAWEPCGDADVVLQDGALTVSAANGVQGGAQLIGKGKSQSVSLLAEVTVTLQMEIALTGDAGAAFTVTMSQRPGDHLPAHLYYVAGNAPAALPPHTACVPLTPTTDGVYVLTVSADARQYAEGGMDNVYGVPGIAVWSGQGGTATLRLSGYAMQVAYSGEDVLRRQRVLGDELGRRYGIKPYITTEISGAGQHKCYYGEQVPCINYRAGTVTQADAIAHVKAHGGIFCYNHPFSAYKKMVFSDEERQAQLEAEAKTLIDAKLYGATLMEVGFPKGRGGFDQADHFALWDRMSLAGLFITGDGDSDSHFSDKGWADGNNFASWIAAPSDMPHPVPDEVFIDSMKAGRLYAGDPTQLRAPIDLTCGDRPMGAILPLEERDVRPREMVFTAAELPEGWTVRFIVSGACVGERTIAWTGAYTFRFAVAPTLPVAFGRVELYNADGRCVGLTNPIYLVRKDLFHGTLPTERLYEEASV